MSLSQKIHEMFPHQRLQMKKYIKRIFGKKYDVRKRRKTILQEKKKISFQFVRNENERFSAWSILLSFSSDSTERKLQ
jgi:putative cell wall-binding protein